MVVFIVIFKRKMRDCLLTDGFVFISIPRSLFGSVVTSPPPQRAHTEDEREGFKPFQ